MKKIIITILCSSFLFLNNVSANESEISKSISELIKLQSQDINEDVFEVVDCSNVTNWSWTSIKGFQWNREFAYWYFNYLWLYANKYITCTNMSEENYLKVVKTSFNLSEEEQKNYSLKVYHRNLYRGEKSEYLTIDNEHLMLSKLGYCYHQAKTVDFLKFCLYDFAKKWEYYFGWNINKNNENQSFYNQYESWVKNENKMNEYFKKIDELMPKFYSKLKNDSNKIADFGATLQIKIDSTNNKNNIRILEYIRNKTLEYLIANNDYNFFVEKYDLEIKSDFLKETKANYLSDDELSNEDVEEVHKLSKKLADLNLVITDWGGYPDIHSIFKDSKYYKRYRAIIKADYRIKTEKRNSENFLKLKQLRYE